MKRCNHSHWLSFGTCGNETSFLRSDRLQTLTHHLQDPETQRPSLLVLIGNASMSLALQELFGTKKAWKFRSKRHANEIHLHLDASTIFHSRPILIAEGDLTEQGLRATAPSAEKCHETTRLALPRPVANSHIALDGSSDSIYSHLLLPFADVFCFFSADLGGFRQIARSLAVWLEKGQSSTLPRSTYPRVIIVTDKIPPGAFEEKEARKAFLWLLREETTHELSKQISDIQVVALLPDHKVSSEARHRRLKECLLNNSDEVRRNKENTRTLFSATHFSALFRYACDYFSKPHEGLFDFVKASRKHNPVAKDLAEHLSIFLKQIKSAKELTSFAVPVIASSILLDNYPPDSHTFEPNDVFGTLYKDTFYQVSKSRVLAFEGSRDVILRSGFISKVESRLREFFDQFTHDGEQHSLEIHRNTLKTFEDRWKSVKSTTTCLVCLRRRPQFGLPCGHIVCEKCFEDFGECCVDKPWDFRIYHCFLCGAKMPKEIVVRFHPPTAGAGGVLCIDGGGIRGVLPLEYLKRIEDCIGLQIPIQRFFKVAFGISSGGLIIMDMFLNGSSIDKSKEAFTKLADLAFEPRQVSIPIISNILFPFLSRLPFLSRVPLLSKILVLLKSFGADSLYPAENIETALQSVFGKEKTILDYSYANSIGARVGVPVATIREPSSCIFTNYNGVGTRDPNQGYHVIQPDEGYGRVPLWEIARAASAAPGFFPPKRIDGVGTFQDPGPLENDPLITAYSEAATMFPLAEEPDFMVSLGTGAPRVNNGKPFMSVSAPLRVWKDRALPRLCRMFWERMRDKHVKQIFRAHPRYHRLDTEFDGVLPMLDNTKSIHELQMKAQEDHSITKVIGDISRCAIASLFYFQLDSIPEVYDDKHIGPGSILCSVHRSEPAFKLLLDQLSGATFSLNNCPLAGGVGDPSSIDKYGNFRKRVELNLNGRFTIALRVGNSEPCNISGSPYLVERLISAQKLDSFFGGVHQGTKKRKRIIQGIFGATKRQRT